MTARFRSEIVILLYHRVSDPSIDPYRLYVSPRNFSEQLEHLSRNYDTLSLKELFWALTQGPLPKRAVVLTFDDGYADFLLNAHPRLRKYRIPASLFVISGFVGKKEFWWDELARLLLLSTKLPNRLKVVVRGKIYDWNLNGDSQRDSDVLSEYSCSPAKFGALSPRKIVYHDLRRLLISLEPGERDVALKDLSIEIDVPGTMNLGCRALTQTELLNLAEDGLVEVGSHSVTHPVLATQPLPMQRHELIESKRHLETMIGRPVTNFAYPYGSEEDIGPHARTIAREAGYNIACSSIESFVTTKSDRYFLPRFWVLDWDGKEFGRHLKSFFA